MNPEGPQEIVTDKGYHSKKVVSDLADAGVRTYCAEPQRGRQRWKGQQREQQAVVGACEARQPAAVLVRRSR